MSILTDNLKFVTKHDLIFLLVKIYGSKEIFINEYKELLSERLLISGTYNTVKERANLELLKTRFGESILSRTQNFKPRCLWV